MSRVEFGEYTAARHVNPDAGDHMITADPAELAAADRATRRSWRRFPYYGRRYGVRGRRFSMSDSGWLVTLCDLVPERARQQVRWLGGVLAARGMPQLLLESHLEMLHEELVAACPADGARYGRLLECAAALREMRVGAMPEREMEALAADFEGRVREVDGRVGAMGVVLTAAVADERAGVVNAVSSLTEWACDPARFSDAWVREVQRTLAEARAGQG